MKGDFSRISFDPGADISRVVFQQGRPLVEADMNEALLTLLNQQREIIRKLTGYETNHGPLDDMAAIPPLTPFMIRQDAENRLRVDGGRYRFESIFATKREDSSARSYLAVGNRYVVDFERGDHNPPRTANFAVGLAVAERPLLLSEIAARAPATADLRSGIPWGVYWEVFLEPYTDPDDKRQEIVNRNPFPPRAVLGLQTAKNQTLARELDNRLWRLEVHSIEGNQVQLKLAGDNAADVFKANKVEAGNVQIERYAGQLPKLDNYVEVESKLSWFTGPGDLHRITEVIEYRDGILASTTSVASEIVDDSAQVRAWHWTTTVPIADLVRPEGVAVGQGPLTVRFDAADEAAATAALREGDGWTLRTGQLAVIGDLANAEVVPGTRRPVYYQALGTANFDGNGNVTVDRESYRDQLASTVFAIGNIAQSVPESTPLRLDPNRAVTHTPCHRLFPEVENLAARRWLASATLGEVSKLSKEQLRTVIQHDCSSDEIDAETLDQDLELIMAKRRQFLPSTLV